VYSYTDSLTTVTVRVYLADTNPSTVIRGAILDGGSNQADVDEMAFASRYNFCIGGFSPSGSYTSYAPAVLRAFSAWAKLDNNARPEFARMPFITTGCSAGGAAGYSLAMYAWKRTLCFGCNVTAGYNPSSPTDSMIRVPGMFTVGEQDPIVGSRDNPLCDTLIRKYRPRGALWSEAVIWGMGHETRRINHMFSAFYEHCIKEYYPASINPRTDSVILVRPTEASGWLAPRQAVQTSTFTTIAPYSAYTGDKSTAEWLLDGDIAWLYRGYTSTDIRMALETPDTFAWSGVAPGGAALNGPGWWAMCCYQPGAPITLVVKDAARLPGWTKIELYRGSTLIDSLKGSQPLQFTVTAPDTPAIQAYNLLVYDNTARVYPSILYSVIVSPWAQVYGPPTAVLRPYQAQPTRQGLALLSGGSAAWFSLAGRAVPADAAHEQRAANAIIRRSGEGIELYSPLRQ
jgi:hypothetical protein